MDTYTSYLELIKPTWAPPSWIFGPVWSVLYILIAISFGYVSYKYFKGEISFIILLPFILNLIFNFAFTPLMFGLKNLPLASIDILLTLGTLIWVIIVIYPIISWVAFMNIPYLLWVSFATVLQLTITYLNK
ncbi:MAG: TspO/MBR family protein [Candidatus Paceibacterota bacterium]|jgi:tryptophan-rich sensory protein